jgi:hypothetical protein
MTLPFLAYHQSHSINSNQDALPFKLFSILSGLVGPQPHQVGCAAFHLLYAYRDADELLKMGRSVDPLGFSSHLLTEFDRVQVADDEFISTSFDCFLPDYAKLVSKPWNDYCSKVVGCMFYLLTFYFDSEQHLFS